MTEYVRKDQRGPIFVLAALLVVVLALATAVPALAAGRATYSWYGSTLYVAPHNEWTGATRNYDGSNVGIEMTGTTSGTFRVELHRGHLITNDYVGFATFDKSKFDKATWTNVGSGKYYFKFDNTQSSTKVSSSDVAMYSW